MSHAEDRSNRFRASIATRWGLGDRGGGKGDATLLTARGAGVRDGTDRWEIEILLGILRLCLFGLGTGASGIILCCVAREEVRGI